MNLDDFLQKIADTAMEFENATERIVGIYVEFRRPVFDTDGTIAPIEFDLYEYNGESLTLREGWGIEKVPAPRTS